jgi:hypothetical protein
MGRTSLIARWILTVPLLLLAACAGQAGVPATTSPAVTSAASMVAPISTASAPGATGSAAGTLTIDVVDQVTQEWIADASAVDEGACPTAKYDENSTGFGDYDVTFFRQLDCYTADGGMGLIQIINYLEFADAEERDRYIAAELTHGELYLVDGLVLVTQGALNEAFDHQALLDRVAQACSCGEIAGG